MRAILGIGLIFTLGVFAQAPAQDEDLMFRDLAVVESAGMHAQSIRDAPANVTLITEDEIRTYGYRTLGEALASARGFYVSNDRAYEHIGLRGLNLPGDYGTRWQVMVNGHPMSDRVFNASGYFGQDFGIDMSLVKRIEIIRGPCSALYGSNAIFGAINVITRTPAESPRASGAIEAGSPGERKLEFQASKAGLGNSEILLAASIFNNAGSAFPVAAYGTTIPAIADSERGYHAFLDFHHGDWEVRAMFSEREKGMPVPWDDAIIGDSANRIWDDRRFVDVSWSHAIGSGQLIWTNSWDGYSYRGLEDFASDTGALRNADLAKSSWLKSRALYQFAPSRFGAITAGGEISMDLVSSQQNYDLSQPGVFQLNVSHRKLLTALLMQDELTLSKRWKAVVGARFDNSSAYGGELSARGALLFQQSETTVWKLVGGRSFSDPSDFEQLYNGVSDYSVAGKLRNETAVTVELNLERQLSRHWSGLVGGYRYQLLNPIELLTQQQSVDGETTAVSQYVNGDQVNSTGVEAELTGQFNRTFKVSASGSIGKTTAAGTAYLPNSPSTVITVRCSRAFWRDRLTVAGGFNYVGDRSTLAGAKTGSAWLPEATLGLRKFANGFQMQIGVRNLSSSTDEQAIALDPRVDSIPGRGRSVFMRVQWRAAN